LPGGYHLVKPAKGGLYTKYDIQLLHSDSLAISLTDGRVSRVVSILGDVHVFVKNDTLEYVYSNLISSSVDSGDTVRERQKIGIIMKNANSKKYELTIRILNGTRQLHYNAIVRNLTGRY
jgi:hypothetical protein